MTQFAAEKQALEKAIQGLSNLIVETVDYQPCVDIGIANIMPAQEVDSELRSLLMDTMSEIMIHRNAVIAGRAKMLNRLDVLKAQLQRIPK